MGGLALLRVLDARACWMPAVLTTARLRWQPPAWAAGRVLEKPFGADELIRVVRRVITA